MNLMRKATQLRRKYTETFDIKGKKGVIMFKTGSVPSSFTIEGLPLMAAVHQVLYSLMNFYSCNLEKRKL